MPDYLVTIILTTLNSEKYIRRSLQSCIEQTHDNLEILIVDGGSQDKTLEVVASFDDARIRVIHQENNTGKLPGAINLGMENAKGAFITWTQDDCWYKPEAIQTMLEFLSQHPDVALVYTDYWDVDEDGKPLKYQEVHPPEDILADDVIRVCFLLRREVFEAIGPQQPEYHPVHEVPWRIKVSQRFKIQPCHTPLMFYIVREGSLTGQYSNRRLRWLCLKILLDEGIVDRATYRKVLAQVEINRAYEEFIEQGSYLSFWRYTLSGIWLNWRWLGDRGLLKLILISLTPLRNKYRSKLLAQKAQELQQKSQLHGQ